MGRSGTLCVMGACARPKRGCMLRCGPRRLSSTPMSSSEAPASTSSPLMRQLGAAPPVFRDMPMPGSGAARNETGWTFYPSCKVADGWMVEADGRGEVALVRVVRSQVGCGRCHFHSSLQPAACTQREQHSFSASREQQPRTRLAKSRRCKIWAQQQPLPSSQPFASSESSHITLYLPRSESASSQRVKIA